MSRISDLIDELCPNGVKFQAVGEVGLYSDTRVNASDLDETSFVGVDNLISGKRGKSNSDFRPNTTRLAAYEAGDILIGNIRPYLKKIWLATNDGGCSGDVLAVRIRPEYSAILEPEFLYLLLSSDAFFAYNMQHAKGAKMPRGDKIAILRYQVPVPPVQVQREIVRVLDQYTRVEAEFELTLDAEYRARRAQYAFYRDAFFDFPESSRVPQVPMGEIGTFIRGRRFTKNDIVEEGIPSIHYGEIYTHYGVAAETAVTHVRSDLASQLRFAQPGDVVIAAVGETVEDVAKAVAWLGNEPVAIHDDTFLFRADMNPKFLSYALQSANFHSQKNKYVARAKVKRLSSEGLGRITIPAPSRVDQDRIVAELDKFSALVTDLSGRLSEELNARRAQYEHYRDHLLTFKEAGI